MDVQIVVVMRLVVWACLVLMMEDVSVKIKYPVQNVISALQV